MRLGEALIQRGILGETQLKRALETQMITGGHLGTCLIELGYIDEDRLGQVLSDLLGVPYAPRDLFEEIPAAVIATMSAGVVDRVKSIPYALRGRTLHVAMVEPKNLHSLDEIGFATGCRVEAAIAPEARIYEAMERYYGIPRRMRYITLCRQMDEEGRAAATQRPTVAAVAGVATMAGADGGAPQEAIGSAAIIETDGGAGPARRPPVPPSGGVDESGIESVEEALCRAGDVDEVARAVVAYASRRTARAIFFVVRDDVAAVREAHGLPLSRQAAESLSFRVVDEPVFKLPLGDPFYRGLVPADAPHRAFFERLGIDPPSEALVIPVHLNDHLVAIFYADAVPGRKIEGDTDQFLRLTGKATIAFSILALKRKLRAL